MRAPEMRESLVQQLYARYPDRVENRVWPEMSVCLGDSRVDVGLVNGALAGYEIKSDRDRLDRLPRQIEVYGRVLDKCALVVGPRRATHAVDLVPDWWGILIASEEAGTVLLEEKRSCGPNPRVDPEAVAQMLWRDEAYEELVLLDAHHALRSATRWTLWDRLVEVCDLDALRAIVRRRLKARPSC